MSSISSLRLLAVSCLLYGACSAPDAPTSPGNSAGRAPDPPGVAGAGSAADSAGKSAAGAGMSGTAGRPTAGTPAAGSGAPDPTGVSPDAIVLTALPANTSIGLDWSRVQGATGYRLFFSTTPGVTPTTGQPIDVPEPAYVHRALQNNTTYYYVVAALTSGALGPPSKEVSAQPTGEWVLEQLGSGDFDNVLDGQRVPRVPLQRRVHILLFGEGYTAADAPIFHSDATHANRNNDVDRWIDEVFALDPYSRMREAFVVWFLPRASEARIGAGTTAFGLTVNNGSVDNIEAAAAPVWSAIEKFPFPPMAGAPLQLVAAFTVLDPMRGRGGLSGVTSGLRNPAGNQSIRTAFGLGYPHEFTHAFASLGDEYIELSGRASRMSETTNVVPTNRCDELPWAHLLEGRGINKTPNLVGAFGTPEQGYHSELRCQLNGTHENGQAFCAAEDERYGNLLLRSQYLCNFCREITTFRIFERTGILTGNMAFATWKAMYRPAFYNRFGFFVPPGALPQTIECNRGQAKPVYQACMP